MKVFDQDFNEIGVDTRKNVHDKGLWHETFHCWFIDREFIYIQKRSAEKADYPSLFDITVAGHLEADETVEDGVREIAEEVGVHVQFSDLTSLGVIPDVIQVGAFLDYEFAHVYSYESSFEEVDFSLQAEEVDSIHVVRRADFVDLCLGKKVHVQARHATEKTTQIISLNDFVPHELSYFRAIGEKLNEV